MLNLSWPSLVWTLRVAAIALLGALLLAASPAQAAKRHSHISITVVSSRADLVSGGSALVAISPGRTAGRLKVTVDGHNVTGRFAVRANGSFEGLVRGLKLGRNVLRATLPNGAGARITLVNHPTGGPLSPVRRSSLGVPGDRSRQEVRPGADLQLPVHVDQPGQVGLSAV